MRETRRQAGGAGVVLAALCASVALGDEDPGRSRLPRRPDDPLAVCVTREAFGAAGDGVADDAPAIQKALDTLQETRGGGIVLLPPGRYRLGRTIHLWKGIRLIGFGPQRPTLVLAADTPAFRDGQCKYLVHFHDARRKDAETQPDAGNTTFASGIVNVDIEIADGCAGVAGVRYRVAQLCTLKWMDFRLGDAAVGIDQIGNEIVGCRFFGGTRAITTGRTSAGWQALLMDCEFAGQSVAAVQSYAAGLTALGCRFRDVPCGIEVPPGRTERLYVRDGRFERVRQAAIVADRTARPDQQINVENTVCVETPRLVDFREETRDVAVDQPACLVASFSHGLHVDRACTPEARVVHATRCTRRRLTDVPAPPPSLLTPLPPQEQWVSVREFGAAGDGKTDDTAALRKAAASGKPLYLPTGRYVLSDTVTLDPNTALIGLHPRATMLVMKPGTAGFGDPNQPRGMLVAPPGGRTIVTGLGLAPDKNPGAITLKWTAGPRSLLDDVFFQYGGGPSGAGLCYGLWVTDGGGGTFKNFWAANGQARNGLFVSDTDTPGTVILASVEHHTTVEVRLAGVRNWAFCALQTETEGGPGEKSTAVVMDRCENVLFSNLYLYRTSRTRSPHPHGMRLSACRNVTIRGVHTFSLSKFPYANTAFDADANAPLPQREAAWAKIGEGRAGKALR